MELSCLDLSVYRITLLYKILKIYGVPIDRLSCISSIFQILTCRILDHLIKSRGLMVMISDSHENSCESSEGSRFDPGRDYFLLLSYNVLLQLGLFLPYLDSDFV